MPSYWKEFIFVLLLENVSGQNREKTFPFNSPSQCKVLNEKERGIPSKNPKSIKTISYLRKKLVSSKTNAKISNLNERNTSTKGRFSEKIKSSLISSLNSLKKIIVLIRCAKIFIFKTKFRDLRFLSKNQVELINDVTHFPEKKQNIYFHQRFTEKNVI